MIGWENNRKLNGDYFTLTKRRSSDITLDYYLDNIDFDNYLIYKATGKFRRVEDIGKYASYIFFRKDIYCKDHIDKWIEEIYEIQSMPYLNKPFPRIQVIGKIEVI